MNDLKKAYFNCLGRASGFSLTELMVAIGVFCILAGIAIPGFINWLPTKRLNSSAMHIFMALSQTRMKAISEATLGVIKFDPANNTFTAWLDDGPAGYNWALDASDTLIKSASTDEGVSITSTTFPSNTFGYNSRGLSAVTPGDYSVTLTNSKGETKAVQVNSVGIAKIP